MRLGLVSIVGQELGTVSTIEGGGLVFWPGKIQFSRFFHENLTT